MKKFSKKTIPLSDIIVNSDNPRFESVSNPTKAFEMMLNAKEKEIKNLATDIIQNGLNPSKNLIVVAKNDKFLALEGNRRIVSLMLLNDPTLAKNKDLREFFHKLKDVSNNNIPSSIPCVVFDNEEDARHWISLEHTGKNQGIGVDPWNSEQTHRFHANASKVVQIFDFADENNLERKKVKTTNLERVLTPFGCKSIGISYPNNELRLDKPKTTVIKNLTKIFDKMSQSTFKVGDIYNKSLIEQWFTSVLGSETSNKAQTNTTSTSKEETTKNGRDTKEKKKAAKSTDRKNLIPQDYELPIKPSKIQDIFLELKEDLVLDGTRATPNAIGVLFRVFLEVSVDYYLDQKKIPYTYKTKLREKINSATEHMAKNKIATHKELKYIRKTATSESTNILSIENFHDYVHSGFIRPESGDLKAKWDNSSEFFSILWNNV